jgi:hypothetical protein
LCVIENDVLMLRTAMEQRDLTKLIDSSRLLWFWREEKSDLFTRLTPYQPSVSMSLTGVVHAPSVPSRAGVSPADADVDRGNFRRMRRRASAPSY